MTNRPLESPAPDPTPLLFLVVAASVLLYSVESMSWTALLLPAVVLLPSVVYLFSANARVALAALIGTGAMSRYFIEIGGLKARPEHIAIGLLLLAVVWMYKRGQARATWIWADLLLVVYIALNIFSSLFASPSPSQTFKWSMQQTLVIAAYFLLRFLLPSLDRFQTAVRILVLVGALEAVYAVICFYSNLYFRTEFGVELGQYYEMPGIFGSQYEANILGSYSGACMIIMLVMYFHRSEKKLLLGIACTFAGLVISLSRAAAGAAVVAVAVLSIYAIAAKVLSAGNVLRVAAALLAVSLVLGPVVVPIYVQRFSTVDIADPVADENTQGRLITLAPAFDDILESPVFGKGTSSFQLGFTYRETGLGNPDDPGWISNTEIRILHDTGALGLAVFAWFFLYVMIQGARLSRRNPSAELRGLLLAAVVYLISFQLTEGSLLAFSWIHIGLIASFIAIHKREHRLVAADEEGLVTGNS